MTAPALIALAHGSRDPRSASAIKSLVDQVRRQQPDLRIQSAFLDHNKPDLATVTRKLVRAGHDEIVVVPLLLNQAYHAEVDVPAAVAAVAAAHPGIEVRATPVLGSQPALLGVLDHRMRDALWRVRCRELDGLVLAAAGTSDALAISQIARLGRLWGRITSSRS